MPGGIKGMGESAMISAPAAIIAAVNDALSLVGTSIEHFPVSPQRIFDALKRASGGGCAQSSAISKGSAL